MARWILSVFKDCRRELKKIKTAWPALSLGFPYLVSSSALGACLLKALVRSLSTSLASTIGEAGVPAFPVRRAYRAPATQAPSPLALTALIDRVLVPPPMPTRTLRAYWRPS